MREGAPHAQSRRVSRSWSRRGCASTVPAGHAYAIFISCKFAVLFHMSWNATGELRRRPSPRELRPILRRRVVEAARHDHVVDRGDVVQHIARPFLARPVGAVHVFHLHVQVAAHDVDVVHPELHLQGVHHGLLREVLPDGDGRLRPLGRAAGHDLPVHGHHLCPEGALLSCKHGVVGRTFMASNAQATLWLLMFQVPTYQVGCVLSCFSVAVGFHGCAVVTHILNSSHVMWMAPAVQAPLFSP